MKTRILSRKYARKLGRLRKKCMEKVSMTWAASIQKVARNQARWYKTKVAINETKTYVRKLAR